MRMGLKGNILLMYQPATTTVGEISRRVGFKQMLHKHTAFSGLLQSHHHRFSSLAHSQTSTHNRATCLFAFRRCHSMFCTLPHPRSGFDQCAKTFPGRSVSQNALMCLSKLLWTEKLNQTSFVRYQSSNHKPIIARFSEEVDVEKLREEILEEKRAGNHSVSLVQRVRQAVAQKCDEAIANLSEDEEKQLKVIQLEQQFLYSEGMDILPPEEMTSEYWLEALNLSSKTTRLKFYLFLQRRAYARASQKAQRQLASKEAVEKTPVGKYEHGRIFFRIYESTMRKWLSYRLASSMQFGIPLVFDMDFEDEMRSADIRNTASQLVDVYGFNRKDEGTPFHIHFLNCSQENSIHKTFQILLQELPDLMVTTSEKSYLDMFDKKDLIYLSPNGRQVMREFDPTAVYIVGAYNDKSVAKPLTYAKAKKEGIRCQRLPIDQHVDWVQGRKELTLDQVTRILLAVKNKQPWKIAFKHLPKRKTTRLGPR